MYLVNSILLLCSYRCTL